MESGGMMTEAQAARFTKIDAGPDILDAIGVLLGERPVPPDVDRNAFISDCADRLCRATQAADRKRALSG
jgi:hypothetical protein